MKNILDDLDDFDEGSKRILRGSLGSIIQLDELNKGIYGSGKDPFEGVRTDKTFREISNEIALESPFGKNSALYRELREIITGQIPKL
ncbi:hypothetical protein [uncultured Chryseobacterium sp.]|jgi:hypothetical protein|uniref:hypothetical protein n=1 Tax=uncultured Chryseobacterium sp. TaxID=259322 RepID=UPI002637D5F2|nr:hypothetical protein [uncultured Chryseobacterium sp.]